MKSYRLMVAVVVLYGYSLCASAQKLTAGNIDEIVKAMTLEEKCHFVLGTGMHYNDDDKFPGTAGSTFGVERLGIPETYCADSQQGLRMNAKRTWDHRDYYPTDFVASPTLASTWDREAAFKRVLLGGSIPLRHHRRWLCAWCAERGHGRLSQAFCGKQPGDEPQ